MFKKFNTNKPKPNAVKRYSGDGLSWAERIKGYWTDGLFDGGDDTLSLSDFWRGKQRTGAHGTYYVAGPPRRTAFSPSGNSANPTILARYLQKLRGTTRLVIRTKKKPRVTWSSSNSDNYFNPDDNLIVLSAQPLADTNVDLSEGQRLDCIIATALHEAAHAEYTPSTQVYDLYMADGIERTPLQHFSFNLVEDGFIESSVREVYPGFAPYFDVSTNYYLDSKARTRTFAFLNRYLHNVDPATYPEPERTAEKDWMDSYEGVTSMLEKATKNNQTLRLHYITPLIIASSFVGMSGHDDAYDEDDKLYKHFCHRRQINIEHLRNGKPLEKFVYSHMLGISRVFRECEQPDKTVEERYRAAREIHDRIIDLIKTVEEKSDEQREQQAEEDMEGGNPHGFGVGQPEQVDVDKDDVTAAGSDNGVDSADGTRLPKVKIYLTGKEQVDSGAMSGNHASDGMTHIEPIHGRDVGAIENVANASIDFSDITFKNNGRTTGDEVQMCTVDMTPEPYANAVYNVVSRVVSRHTRSIKRSLQFRSSEKVFTQRDRPHGRLDTTRLADYVAHRSRDIFEKTVVASAPSAHVAILVDESGSMGATTHDKPTTIENASARSTIARASAIAIANALDEIDSVSYEVWGHTYVTRSGRGGAYSINSESMEAGTGPVAGLGHNGPLVMRYVDSRKGIGSLKALGRINGRSGNTDAVAIKRVGDSILSQPAERNLLIVICDGLPGDVRTSPFNSPEEHVKHVVGKLRNQNVSVFSIYVGDGSIDYAMNLMYGTKDRNWIDVRNMNNLPTEMKKLTKSFLKWEV